MTSALFQLIIASCVCLAIIPCARAQTGVVEAPPIEEPPQGLPQPVESDSDNGGVLSPDPGSKLPPFDTPVLIELPSVGPALVAATCTLSGKSEFAMQLGDTKLLDLKFRHCNLEIADDGVVTASVTIQATLNLDADVARCAAFQIATLFEGNSADDRIRWHGYRTIIRDLILENIDGDKKDLGYFYIHNRNTDQLQLRTLLFASSNQPGYPDIYWGIAYVLQEDSTGPLASEIRRLTPIVHENEQKPNVVETPDLTVSVRLEAYEPRGWCLYKDASGSTLTTPLVATMN
jgi:hypothetical protein